MEETQPNATAKRKRRSSILKNQRPARTPFSELEFHVATPTDTAKSRRVSFSRKTGVAEFATNEATTTWKNFYEEQNRSLESSGHDAGANSARPTVGHLGNRIFEQQFEDIEVDFVDTMEMPKSLNANSSLHFNVEEQLALLESTGDDKKLTAPPNNLELSMFTENHSSKMFADNFSNPVMAEMSGRNDINFSAVQSISLIQDIKHDLDNIDNDFSQPNVVCPGPLGEKSEYIEIDLNMTQGQIQHNNESDMSITDTIHSPKKELSKSSISIPDLKIINCKDWIEDKENIIVNPYVAPDEADNFAINEAPEKVLVFTGKTLKYADIDADLDEMDDDFEKKTSKKSLLNMSEKNAGVSKILVYNTSLNMSITRAVPGVIQNTKRQTIVYDHDDANADVSMTQCVPVRNDRILISANDDLADMSMTQAVSKEVQLQSIHKADVTKFCDDMDDMSFTKSVPVFHVDSNENVQKRQTIVFKADDAKADISVTQCVSDVLVRHISSDKTVVFNQDDKIGDISVTQAVPNGILAELLHLQKDDDLAAPRRQTVHFQDADLSMTQAIPSNLAALINKSKGNTTLDELAKEFEVKVPKRKTIVFDTDDAEMSMTQAIPRLIQESKRKSIDTADNNAKMITIDFDDDDMSMTQAVPKVNSSEEETNKRKTIVFNTDDADMSMTQAIPQLIQESKRKAIDTADNNAKRKTIDFDDADRSMTQAVPKNNSSEEETNKRKTIVFEQDAGDISMTQAIPAQIINDNKSLSEIHSKLLENTQFQNTSYISETSDILVYQAVPAVLSNQRTDDELSTKSVSANNSNVIENNRSFAKTSHEVSEVSVAAVNSEVVIGHASGVVQMESVRNNHVVDPALDDNINQNVFRASAASVDSEVSAVKKDTSPSSKGDEFHASSMKLNADPDAIVAELKNPRFSHSHKAPKVGAKRLTLQGEPIGEEAIKSLCYDEMVTSSTRIEHGVQSEVSLCKNVAQETDRDNEKSDHSATGVRHFTGPNDKTSSNESNKSLLDSLLNMSDPVIEKFVDKDVSAKIGSDSDSDKVAVKSENSDDSMFLIIKDSKDNVKTETDEKEETLIHTKKSIKFSDEIKQPVLEQREPDDKTEQNKKNLTILQNISREICDLSKRRYSIENDGNTTDENIDTEARKSGSHVTNINRTFKDADDTNELLEMLSKYTDKSIRRLSAAQDETKHGLVTDANSHKSISYSNKSTNISQDNRGIIAEAETDEQSRRQCSSDDSINDSATQSGARKSIRMSNEVIKTLNFDESESGLHDTPLKKTALGETEYMREHIGNVIPNYDYYDGVKELMKDLVQPNADLSFNKKPAESTTVANKLSTCSTQIQTNIVTPSQVDLPSSHSGDDALSVSSVQTDQTNKYTDSTDTDRPDKNDSSDNDRPRKSILKNLVLSENEDYQQVSHSPLSHRVIVFDPSNPLNNVLLAPVDFSDAHRYNPDGGETVTSASSRYEGKEKTINRFSVVEKRSNTLESGDSEETFAAEGHNRSQVVELKDMEVNTMLTMKGTQELLAASSSLTLVDDGVSSGVSIAAKDAVKKSPLEVIYTTLDSAHKLEAGQENSRKRNYSPEDSNSHVTPKPASKHQKLSFSPEINNMDYGTRKSPTKKSPKKSPRKSPILKQSVTIQQLLTECKKNPEEPSALNKQLIHALQGRTSISSCASTVQSVSEANKCTRSSSSSNQEICQDSDASEPMSICIKSKSFNATRSDWQPELLNEMSSKNLLTESESSVNVVAKINVLPFMGSRECEWDAADVDAWSFHLLQSRIRLVVRLVPQLENATSSCVRADTTVDSVTIEPVKRVAWSPEKQNSVGGWCVQFALAGMRHALVSMSRPVAGGVPALLRQCAGVARVALRWGRAMQDARLRLAYTILGERLTFKVANVPLRCIWEVSLAVRCSSGADGILPAPLAVDVRVSPLLNGRAGAAATAEKTARYVRQDWGHVPRTIWKVFKYLKHLKDDEDLL